MSNKYFTILNNKTLQKCTCLSMFLLTVISFFLGFYFRENSAGGGTIDFAHEWHNYNLLKNNIWSFISGDYEASRFPLYHIINIKINPFINSKADFLISFFLYSFILCILFFISLKVYLKHNNNYIILLLSSILLLSPYFRTSSYWGLQENLPYIFLLSSIIAFELNKEKKVLITLLSFLCFYSDQKFAFVPLIFFIHYLNFPQIISKENFKLLFLNIFLFIPAVIIFYKWGGITKSETASGINEFSFSFQNILFSLNIVFFYLLPFYMLKKNILLEFKTLIHKPQLTLIFFFVIVYFFIRYFFLDTNLPISGGWAFKIFLALKKINLFTSEIFYFLISFLSWIFVILYWSLIKYSQINKIIFIFILLYGLFIEIIFQEYFDPLLIILAIFFFQKKDLQLINFKKSLFLYFYFLVFWLGSLFYYKLIL